MKSYGGAPDRRPDHRPFRDDAPRGGRGDRPQGGRPAFGAPGRPAPGDRPFPPRPAKAAPGRFPPRDRPEGPNAFRPAPPRPAPAPFAPAPAPESAAEFEREAPNILAGRNPIREALKVDQPLEKLLVAEGDLSGSARQIVAVAREKGVVVQFVDRARLDKIYPNHQGMLAFASAASYATVEEILDLAREKGEDPFVVVLDGVTDPHNLGAIIRSCECMGAHGVIVMDRRSAGLTPATAKAAAGALSHIKVARVTNLSRAIAELKEKGLWVTGTAADGTPIDKLSLTGPLALVVGSEGEGMSRLVAEACDQMAAIPLYGSIPSLNASVACGIALYEIARARHA